MDRPPFIKNLSVISEESHYLDPEPEKYRTRKRLAKATGAKSLGVNQSTLRPGQVSSKLHRHLKEEEFLLILQGRAVLRYGSEKFDLIAGDAVSFLPNTEPHQLINTSDEDCVYLEVSTRVKDDVIEYPG